MPSDGYSSGQLAAYDPNDRTRARALSRVVTGEMIGAPAFDSNSLSQELPETEGADVSRYVHALRRRWLLSTVIGVPLALLVGLGIWQLLPENYTATALLRVATSETPLVFLTADSKVMGHESDSYKRDQRQYLQSPFVIISALRNLEMDRIPALKNQSDPVVWIGKHLSVTFPDDAAIMKVSLTGPAPQGLNDAVNAIVDAYFKEIVQTERETKNERLSDLESICVQKDNELRLKRSQFKDLAGNLSAGDPNSLSLLQQNYIQEFSIFQQQYAKSQLELIQAQNALARYERDAKASDAEAQSLISDADVAKVLESDKITQSLETERNTKRNEINVLRDRFRNKPEQAETRSEDIRKRIDQLSNQLEERRQVVRREMLTARRQTEAAEAAALRQKVGHLTEEQKQLQEHVDSLRKQASVGVRSSVEVEMMKHEITALEEVRKGLANELERTKVELLPSSKDARVKLLMKAEPARPPESVSRIGMTAVASLFTFGLPFVALVWLDARKYRIHTAMQVAEGARVSVIGSVPVIPKRVMRRLNGPSRREQYWRTLLSESVDAVAAVVIRSAQTGANRVVMVSSATAGEGKTTLAGQLAVSLAGTGRQTLLVDFDLRRPTLHRVFGLTLAPGINEVLRGELELEAAIQPTLVPNLTILSAGRSNQTGLAGLPAGDLKALFDRLRSGFEFVVVDASPILPVVDTRLIGQHVDAVLLSVLRDVSRVPKLRAACQFLELFGIPVLGAVVAGSTEEAYTDSHYESLSETRLN